MSKLYIIDGNSLLFRSFYASYRPGMDIMRAKDGTPTNALYSFRNMMVKIKSELKLGDKMIVCFDTGKKTFRSKELESYKMNRKPCEPDLVTQIPLSRILLDCLGIEHCELDGYEADDLAGSLTYYGIEQKDDITLFTSDKDYLQLLKDGVKVNFLRKGLSNIEVFNKENIKEKMGFEADQVIDYKGLVGDPSDNIKGVKGVGEKTAIKLIEKYGHIESILEGIKDDKSKVAQNIIENKDVALFCKRMATIVTDLDVKDYYDHSSLREEDDDKLLEFYKRYDFVKFMKELQVKLDSKMSLFSDINEENSTKIKPSLKVEEAIDIKAFKEINKIPSSILVSCSSTNYHSGDILGFYFEVEGRCYFLSIDRAIKDEDFKKYLVSDISKKTYDLKGLIVALDRCKLPLINNVSFDLLLATYLLNADVEQSKKGCLSFFNVEIEEDKEDITLVLSLNRLYEQVIQSLKDNEEYSLYEEVELPLTSVLARMENEGFPLNKDELEKINVRYKNYVEELKNQIFTLVGHELNLNSPKQVGELIYDELQLKKRRKSAPTDIEVLKSIATLHPVVPLIIAYRKYNKIVTSYTDALNKSVYEDGKLHAVFNQALTTTGRLSMSEPNLQNISIRDEEGKEIRKAFFYKDYEYKFLSFDYSQIELRVLASVADIKELQEIFNNDEDIHTSTAMKVFGVSKDEVTSLMRRKAKAVNFGIVYGISDWGLASQIGTSAAEAHEIIENFYKAYSGLKEYEDNVIRFAHENGYVKTLLGRRRYLKDIDSPIFNLRSFSERAAVNATIQGTAADLIKVAMIRVDKLLENYQSKMVLQIHDELIFKLVPSEYDELKVKIKDIMEHAIELKCKLMVEGDIGDTWYDCK